MGVLEKSQEIWYNYDLNKKDYYYKKLHFANVTL